MGRPLDGGLPRGPRTLSPRTPRRISLNTDTMKKHLSKCQCCGDPTPDITRRFSSSHGFVCPPCHEGLDLAHTMLAFCAGAVGLATPADRVRHKEVAP